MRIAGEVLDLCANSLKSATVGAGGVPESEVPISGDFEQRKTGMRQDVIDRQVGAMKAARLDAVLSCSPENFAYVTGFLSPTQPLMRWRHAMALVTADGKAALMVVDMEASTIRARVGEAVEVAVWREFAFEAMAVLA